MTAELIEDNTGENYDKLICEACGKEFFCGAKVGECRCFAFELQTKTLTELRENYQNCLCEDCLEKFGATARAVAPNE